MSGKLSPGRQRTAPKGRGTAVAHPESRIAIIGAGHVGATTAYALMLRALFSEIVLIDSNQALARAEAADLQDANALARPAAVWAGDYADAATASIAVITAGGATHGSQARLAVVADSATIVSGCVAGLIDAGFDGIMVVAANPVDIMALLAQRRSGLPASRVIGTGTLLDTSRLKQALSRTLQVASSTVQGLVLGEHGDSEVVAFSTLRVEGLSLDRLSTPDLDEAEITQEVRRAGYEIIAGKGYTSFGVATAIVHICEAIARNERTVLPVSTLLTGEFGISGVYLSLPCVIGRSGVERVLSPALTDAETDLLRHSAEVLRKAAADIGLD